MIPQMPRLVLDVPSSDSSSIDIPCSAYLDVPCSVEVEQIPCSSPLPSPSKDYYDFNVEDCISLDQEDCDMDQLSQLTCKTPQRKRKLYECTMPECNKSYPKPAQLTYHVDTEHLNLKWFTCIYKNCNKSFYYPGHMKRHLRTHGPNQWHCDLCYGTFSRHENLKVHQRKCRLLLVCSVCGETFISGTDIQKHRQTHCVYLKCLYKDCDEHIAPNNIREHLFLHGNVVKCPLCAAMFLYQRSLEQHMARDHKTEMAPSADYTNDVDIEGWFQSMFCDLQSLEEFGNGCGDDIGSLSGVGDEVGGLSGVGDEGGSIRDVKSVDNCRLDMSSNSQTLEIANDIAPSESSLEDSSKSEFKSPNKTPDNSVLYKCSEPGCSYSTPTPRWLTKHTLKHRKKGAIECHECHRVFGDKWGLNLHRSSHSDKSSNFACAYCDKCYPSQSRLSQHCQSCHPESRTWRCEECLMSFSTSKRLMFHYRKHVTGETNSKK